jgi:membrane protein DedA with SNARE-associated domain
VAAYADRVVPPTERFFQLHGGKTVFVARFITGLRVAGAWIAGVTRMDWWRFLCWNAAGGIAWAAGIGFLTYYLGRTTAGLLGHYGLVVGGVADVAAALVGLHLVLRHLQPGHRVAPASAGPAR